MALSTASHIAGWFLEDAQYKVSLRAICDAIDDVADQRRVASLKCPHGDFNVILAKLRRQVDWQRLQNLNIFFLDVTPTEAWQITMLLILRPSELAFLNYEVETGEYHEATKQPMKRRYEAAITIYRHLDEKLHPLMSGAVRSVGLDADGDIRVNGPVKFQLSWLQVSEGADPHLTTHSIGLDRNTRGPNVAPIGFCAAILPSSRCLKPMDKKNERELCRFLAVRTIIHHQLTVQDRVAAAAAVAASKA